MIIFTAIIWQKLYVEKNKSLFIIAWFYLAPLSSVYPASPSFKHHLPSQFWFVFLTVNFQEHFFHLCQMISFLRIYFPFICQRWLQNGNRGGGHFKLWAKTIIWPTGPNLTGKQNHKRIKLVWLICLQYTKSWFVIHTIHKNLDQAIHFRQISSAPIHQSALELQNKNKCIFFFAHPLTDWYYLSLVDRG